MSENKNRKRYLSDVITPKTVDACCRWSGASDYRDALAMVPGMAARHDDADDVASLASVLLGDCLDSGLTGSLAAGAATKRAAQLWQGMTLGEPIPAGDTFTEDAPGTHLPRPFIPAPDGIAEWSNADTLASLCTLLTPGQVALLGIAYSPEHADPRGKHGVSASALASTLAGTKVNRGKASQAAAALLGDALHAARSVADDVVAVLDLDSTSRGNGTDAPRWDDVLTGTASPVVTTSRVYGPCVEGAVNDYSPGTITWAVLPGGTVVEGTTETLAPLLAWVSALPALPAGNVRESTTAEVLASTLPERHNGVRPQGVGVGMVHGAGRIAGDQAPKPRPAAPAKRKRDGGIGGPMTRA